MGQLPLDGSRFLASTEGGHAVTYLGVGVYLALVLAVVFVTLHVSRRGLNPRVFTHPLTRLYEHLYLFIENMCVGIIGGHGRKYVPMIMTLWLVIFVSNVIALIFPMAPTAILSFNLGMAILCVSYVQYEGVSMHYRGYRTHGANPLVAAIKGIAGHLLHFTGPKMSGTLLVMSGFIFVIEIVSEMMKNISLSLRLFGNIHGGHEAVTRMNDVGAPLLVPLGEFLLPIKFLTCIVQAMIFTLLTCAYLSLVTHHEHNEHAERAESDRHGHAEPAAVH